VRGWARCLRTRHLLERSLPTLVLAGENWSFVLQESPGCLAALGAAPPDVAEPAPIRSGHMVIDETAMATGIALHVVVALSPEVVDASCVLDACRSDRAGGTWHGAG
jgi:metal-dependent amidase/aminoacylase/carboxypeptidase family protein